KQPCADDALVGYDQQAAYRKPVAQGLPKPLGTARHVENKRDGLKHETRNSVFGHEGSSLLCCTDRLRKTPHLSSLMDQNALGRQDQGHGRPAPGDAFDDQLAAMKI